MDFGPSHECSFDLIQRFRMNLGNPRQIRGHVLAFLQRHAACQGIDESAMVVSFMVKRDQAVERFSVLWIFREATVPSGNRALRLPLCMSKTCQRTPHFASSHSVALENGQALKNR